MMIDDEICSEQRKLNVLKPQDANEVSSALLPSKFLACIEGYKGPIVKLFAFSIA
jgi:hypothetical protein